MSGLRIAPFILLYFLATCGDTNLSGGVSLESGGTPIFEPGDDLVFSETNMAEFSSGNLNQLRATGTGELVLDRDFIGETGRLNISNEISVVAPTAVSFRNSYSNPVVVAYIASRNNGEPMDVRVTNVSTTGFEVFIDDPEDDGIAAAETVVYLVIEQGRHDFANGLSIEADRLNTSSNHDAGDAFGGDVVTFSSAFVGTPVVLHTLNTYNNGDFKSSVCDSANSTQMTLEQASADVGSPTVAEDIGWVAISQGNGTLIDINFDVATFDDGGNDGIGETAQVMTYVGFALPPDLIVKGSSGGGADGYWMRGAGVWTNLTHEAYAEEDQVGDAETNHANEVFNIAAFTPDSDIGVYFSSGSRETTDIDLSQVKRVEQSILEFSAVQPAGTTVTVETNLSLDGGDTWQGWTTQTSGQEVAGLSDGVDVTQGLLKIRYTLASSDEEATPEVTELSLTVVAKTSLD